MYCNKKPSYCYYDSIHPLATFALVFTFCVLQEDTMKLSDFLEEAAIMKEMKHPNLVQVNGKNPDGY